MARSKKGQGIAHIAAVKLPAPPGVQKPATGDRDHNLLIITYRPDTVRPTSPIGEPRAYARRIWRAAGVLSGLGGQQLAAVDRPGRALCPRWAELEQAVGQDQQTGLDPFPLTFDRDDLAPPDAALLQH